MFNLTSTTFERRLRKSVAPIAFAFLLSACNGITVIKYTYDEAWPSVRLQDNTVVTAPPGHHFAVFNINCIDNTDRTDAFFYARNNLRQDGNHQVADVIPTKVALVPAGEEEEGIGPVVFLIAAPPGETYTLGETAPVELPVHYRLNYTSSKGQSVLMHLQNHQKHPPMINYNSGPFPASPSDLQPASSLYGQKLVGNVDLCADDSVAVH